MSSQTIRLRLVIRRHAVPEVKLVWPCIANDDLTVSKLLALVNEVVPLESADWGLEDYVVELADGKGDSFELLHFQPVGKVLKEDDQVLIRSLSTEDLKRRRLSGRHQISYDGKHLIDGLAFGRPWLRPPRDRPALDLPPRKRARITHEEEDDDDSYADEEAASEQLLLEGSSPTEDREEPDSVRLRARFVDTDQLGEEDEEMDDDTDFQLANDRLAEPEVEEDEDSETSDEDEPDADLADELKLLQEDNALIEQGSEQEEISSPDNIQEAQTAPAPMFDLSMLDKITALRAAFPFTSMSTMQDSLRDHDLKETYQILSKTNSPTVSYDEVLEIALLGAVLNPTQSSKQGPEEDADEEENEEEEDEVEEPTLRLPGQPEADSKRPLIQEVNDDESPSEAPTSTRAKPKSLISVVDEGDDTSSSSSSSDSDSDSDSESDEESDNSQKEDSDSDSHSDSSDDSSDDDLDDGLDDQPKDASSSDSSDSDSDSDVAPRLVKVAKAMDISGAQDSDSSDSSSDSDSSSSDSDSESEPEELSSKKAAEVKQSRAAASPEVKTQDTKPPGAGLAKTKKRNARRRDLKRLRAMQALEDTQSQPSTNGAASEDAEFLARKRALLSVVSDESEDVPSPPKETTATGPSPMIVEVETQETPAPATTEDAATTGDSAQRRHKVDMGAGRRMLFGALGLKNPKSKAEEDKLRKSLMKDVKPLQNPRAQTEEAKVNGVEPTTEQEEEDPEAWRKVISYRAVECCQEGVILSEPPFPFVQRWDPQQQYSSMRKRKRTSQDFNDDSYYGEDSQWNGDEEWQEEDTQKKKKKKSKKRKGKGGYDGGYDEMEITEDSYAETRANGNDEEDIVLNYDDIPKPRLQDTQFTEMDDLPTLPSDLSTLPSLELSDAKPGMVITWKQLLMSKATKWQPEMVSMTGLVLSIDQDNCLHVLLAKRDRDEDDKEYDEHTGQRVYAKFEVPDLDEDDDGEEDNGRREIAWEEMSEPRLVQPAPSDNSSGTLAKGKELLKEHAKPAQDDSMANNKVSAPTHPDETMAEELDTQKVRAEVEADLKDREAATADRPSGTDKSISIPSGQQPPRLEFMGTGDNSPISSFVRQMETLSDVTNSPTRQLRETIEEVPLTKALEDFISNVEEKKDDEADGAKDAKDLDDAMPTVEPGWDTIVPDSMPSPDLPPLSKKDDVPVDHRLLVVLSSAGSVRSGRQPPSVSGLEDLPEERIEDSVVDNGPHKRTPSPQISAVSVRSSSPFPPLEEIFATARQTQSPAKFSQPSVPRFLKTEKRDVEYEEAMRKLDEGEDESDRSHGRNKSLRSLFPHATQEKSPLQHSIKSEVVETERTAAPRSSQKIKEESQFVVPDGSQVIELSSSSSPPYVEHYAEDNEDETYDDSPLPQGSGWVQKNYSEVKTRSRGKSLPATAAKEVKDKTVTTTETRAARGRTSLPPARAVTASAFSQIRGRRKPTRKF